MDEVLAPAEQHDLVVLGDEAGPLEPLGQVGGLVALVGLPLHALAAPTEEGDLPRDPVVGLVAEPLRALDHRAVRGGIRWVGAVDRAVPVDDEARGGVAVAQAHLGMEEGTQLVGGHGPIRVHPRCRRTPFARRARLGRRTHARRSPRSHAEGMDLATVRDLAAATPTSRNRVVDLLRAAAILVVVLGHWLLAAVVVRDGELVTGHLLDLAPWTHPLTWVCQVMPVFFLVGGYSNALSWRSAVRRGDTYAGWLRARLRRLLTPVVPLLLVWLVASSVAYAAGVPGSHAAHGIPGGARADLVPRGLRRRLRRGAGDAVALGAHRLVVGRRRARCSAALVDLVSIGTDTLAVGFANYLVVWASVHQVGYAWLDGRLAGTRRRLGLAAVGLAGTLRARVGRALPRVDDRARRGRREQLLPDARDPRLPRPAPGGASCSPSSPCSPAGSSGRGRGPATVLVNTRIMTIYLWHLTAMVGGHRAVAPPRRRRPRASSR